MKIFYSTLFFLFTISLTQAQWTNLNPAPDANDLWSTFFIDDSTGWIVGSDGFITKTTNAGNEWIKQNSGTTLILKAVQFVDQNTGWICGDAGLILKSTDGGKNWDSLSSNTTQHLSDIHFYDADTGYVVGFSGTILKTTNGGLVWTSLNSGTSNDLFTMDFFDAFIGYAAGEVNDTSSVIKTTDGGATWIDKSNGFPTTRGSCLTVEFIDANTGFIGGSSPFFYKTTDGGDTWVSAVAKFPLIDEDMIKKEQLSMYSSYGITSVYFKDANNGWYVYAGGTDESIYGTTDSGITWKREYLAYSVYSHTLLSVFVTQNGTGLAVGAFGYICLKEDSSSDWSQLFSGRMDDVYSIHFIDENIGWATGNRYGNPDKAIILKTTNGGKIWKTQLDRILNSRMLCIYFINENIGWAIDEDMRLFRTIDGGENWSSSGRGGSSVFFINQNTGWLTSNFQSYGIYKSTDGGITWTQKSSITSSSVFFSDINNGWAVGAGGSILKSTDGGETWLAKTSGTANDLKCLRFYDSNIGMCVGNAGTVLLSTDGGENWISQNIGTTLNLTSVALTNPTTTWVAGDDGTILNSTDLGYNWTSYDSVTTKDLTSLCFVNEYTGWFGGLNGTIFKYSTEPIPSIMLTSPNGWEIWKSGSQRNITWTSEHISHINLYYSTNGGSDWNTITTNIDASSGSYTWTIPNLQWFINLNCKVKIEDASNTNVYDLSDNNFIIWHLCNIIQYANSGQRVIDFLETNIDISLNVTASGNISATYYPYETPPGGSLPSGVVVLSDYYWQVTSTNLIFSSGKMIVPISSLRGVTDATKLVWLKRTNSGDPWENIGGLVVGDNLESMIPFNTFSEFAVGSTDPANPLPVELSSFTAINKSEQIILEWVTKTETNNYGFEIERKLSDQWQKIGFVEGNGNSNSTKEYSFTDNKLIGGTKFQYRLKQIDNDGRYEYSAVVEVENIPTEYALYQNYPNPFNPTTKIRYQLPKESKVVIKVYNILGSEVLEFLNENKEPGIYEVEFNASNLSSGTYIYKISAENFMQTKKMMLIK